MKTVNDTKNQQLEFNVGLRKKTIFQADRNEGNFADHSSEFSESETFEDDVEEAEPTPVPVEEAEPIPVPVEEAEPIPVPVEEAGPIPVPVEEAGPIPVPGEEVAAPIPLPVEELAPPIPIPVEELAPPIPLLELDYLDGIRTPEQIVRIPEARRVLNPPRIPPAPPADNLAKVHERLGNIEVTEAQIYLSEFQTLKSDGETGGPVLLVSEPNQGINLRPNLQFVAALPDNFKSDYSPTGSNYSSLAMSFVPILFLFFCEVIRRWLVHWFKPKF